MPHDRNGKVIHVGDEVTIRARVTEIITADGYCNTKLETVEIMYPGDQKSVIWLNAKQVELASDPQTGDEQKVLEEA